MTYEHIRPKLKTGDIVLFNGTGGVRELIKRFTRSPWNHVGMVMKLPEWDFLLLWESTTLSSVKHVETGKETQGVQLVPLSNRIVGYDKIGFKRLREHLTADQQEALLEFRKEVKGRPYEKSYIELAKSALDIFGDRFSFSRNSEALHSLFCSELVAEAYQRIGLLSEDIPSNEYVPGDFDDDSLIDLGEIWYPLEVIKS